MLSETEPAVMWIVAGPPHSTSTTPFTLGPRPWLQEVLEPSPPDPPALPPALLAGAPAAAAVVVPPPVWVDALLPEEPHPATASRTAVSSAALETAGTVRDI